MWATGVRAVAFGAAISATSLATRRCGALADVEWSDAALRSMALVPKNRAYFPHYTAEWEATVAERRKECGGAEVVCLTDDGRTADVFGEEEEEGGT